MAQKYKIKITKAYYITIEDENGYEVASDWSFLDYKETKKQAEKLLAEVERREPKEDKMASVLSDMIDDGWKIQF